MSDERRDNEENDFDKSKRPESSPEESSNKEGAESDQESNAPQDEGEAERPETGEGGSEDIVESGAEDPSAGSADSVSDEDEARKKEEFDEVFGDDPEAYGDDYYYNEYDDYGLEDLEKPRKPKSAAVRMLSRQRAEAAAGAAGSEGEEDAEDEDEDEGMSFLEHLEEFRWTIAKSILAFFLGLLLVAINIRDVAGVLEYPILTAYGSSELVDQNLITYRPMGVISVMFQVALLGGLTLSMPFVLFFIAAFVAPGLTEKERKVLRPSCLAAFVLFLCGAAFAFFVILPLTLAFSVRLNLFFGFDLFWAASDYYNMVVWFSLATGAFFQFPLIIVVLVYLQVIPISKLKAMRRGVFVGLMLFSALMSPGGDFISLPVTTGLMYGLYELAILIGSRIERKKKEEEADATEARD